MICPHCKKEFETTKLGMVDCPSCGKPVFIRAPRPVVQPPIQEKEAAPDLSSPKEPAEVAVEAVAPIDTMADQEQPTAARDGNEAQEDNHSQEQLRAEQQRDALISFLLAGQNDNGEKAPKVTIICTPPWEQKQLSWWRRFWYTARDVTVAPFRFFATLPDNLDKQPMRYSYIIWLLFFVVSFGMQYWSLKYSGENILSNLPPEGIAMIEKTFGSVDRLGDFMLLLLAGSPMWALFPPYIMALLLQGLLWVLNIDNRGYAQALRVVSYSATPLLLVLIPPIFGAAVLAYLPVLSLAISFSYRCRFLLAFPLALLTSVAGLLLITNLMTSFTQIIFSL